MLQSHTLALEDLAMKTKKFMRTSGLANLVRNVEQWRRSRTRIGPMPEKLWCSAAHLARQHGVGCVARAAGLSYIKLRELAHGNHMEKKFIGSVEKSQKTNLDETCFVEMTGRASPPPGGIRIELQDHTGARMVLHATRSDEDLATFCASFWSRSCYN